MSESVLVVGAGICGLCTGIALANEGHRVTIIERDSAPPAGDADEAFFNWRRRGAAQFRHPHAFLAVMSNLLADSFPDLIDDFFAAGARKITFADMLPPELEVIYEPEPGDEKMWLLMCRRATMETVFRRYAERQDNLTILSDTQVVDIITEPEASHVNVRGLEIQQRGEESTSLNADITIDAGGRNSQLKGWLASRGASFTTEDDDAEIVYYTRHYKLLPGVDEPKRDNNKPSAGDLGYMKFGVFPGDGGHFAVIICVHNDETALREAIKDGDTYDAMCRSIPGLVRWVAADKAEATTPSFGFGDIHAVWHHSVVDGKPAALNFFSVGDAAVRTNPLYGRGCSTGIIHAHLLTRLIREVRDPLERALMFDQWTEEELRPIFKASLREDKKGIAQAKAILEGREFETNKTFKAWFEAAFGDALRRASRENLQVLRGVMRTFNLLEKPGDFLKDWRVRLAVFRYMLYGRKRNAGARMVRGPSRDEMLKLINARRTSDQAAAA